MIRWFSSIWPLGFFLPFALFWAGLAWASSGLVLTELEWRPVRIWLGVMAVTFAGWRAMYYSPVLWGSYGEWLTATPWTSRQRLPMGPAHLVFQDLIVIAYFVAIQWVAGDGSYPLFAQVFLFSYLIVMAIAFWPILGQGKRFILPFAIGLLPFFWNDIIPWCLTAALVYAVYYFCLRASLAGFPWGSVRGQAGVSTTSHATRANLGLPFFQLAPCHAMPVAALSIRDSLFTSALAAWWSLAILSWSSDPVFRQTIAPLLSVFPLGCAAIRLMIYVPGHAPPISILGRIFTGRLIIPGYDQVFVPTLLTIWVVICAGSIHNAWQIDPRFVLPPTVFAGMSICLVMGPTRRSWQLTGNCRLTYNPMKDANLVRIS